MAKPEAEPKGREVTPEQLEELKNNATRLYEICSQLKNENLAYFQSIKEPISGPSLWEGIETIIREGKAYLKKSEKGGALGDYFNQMGNFLVSYDKKGFFDKKSSYDEKRFYIESKDGVILKVTEDGDMEFFREHGRKKGAHYEAKNGGYEGEELITGVIFIFKAQIKAFEKFLEVVDDSKRRQAELRNAIERH